MQQDKPETLKEVSDPTVGIFAVGFVFAAAFFAIWVGVTIIQWFMFCKTYGSGFSCSTYYSLAEILNMQWQWLTAHKLF